MVESISASTDFGFDLNIGPSKMKMKKKRKFNGVFRSVFQTHSLFRYIKTPHSRIYTFLNVKRV